MRVVVVGATGNVGTSLVQALSSEPAVASVLGLARRLPVWRLPKVEWAAADIASDELVPHFRGADAVVHLAWAIQPSRDRNLLWRVNVHGSDRVFWSTAEADVPALVYASSVGAYSLGPKDRYVDESWPTNGTPTSFYARHKADVERRLDRFEQQHPEIRTVRLRPGLIFKRESGEEQRRLFAGRLFPRFLARNVPVVPELPRLRFQAVHSDDVAEAYRLAVTREARGVFNVAADPVLDPRALARILHARKLRMPVALARAAVAATWRLRLQPTPEGWLDMALAVPLMDTTRAREELGWEPSHGADEAIRDVLEGISKGGRLPTPPLTKGALT
jgi:UDP-glucose 4-epimerase